jgi:hypothetical protein
MPVLAQRGGHGGGMHGGGGSHGGGSGGFHGSSGGFHGSSGFHGGFRGANNFRGGFRYRTNFGYYYPSFYGGYYDPFFWDSGFDDPYGYSNPSYGYSDPGYAYAPPPPEPALREYIGPTEGAKANQALEKKKYEEPLYLIAMRDGTIRAVLAYWTNGPTLHYVTMDHEQKQAPLNSVDRSLSERLNHERNVTFTLPG